MAVAGAVLGVLGMGLAFRSALLLAGRGRPRRGPQPAFVLTGPYLRMRNPVFAGLVLAVTGAALWSGSQWGALVVAVAALAAHGWVVAVEEVQLRRRFGEAYMEYVRRVPRWIPLRRGPRED
ncbi:MAG TPA: isoprenylcysteine carboxylmethyltransferase family protein [Candidatus Binatia bacterium]|nr:isoprenylcysteine carboxylmethyltransferase family protein [Candidatus Binatia bacterium]